MEVTFGATFPLQVSLAREQHGAKRLKTKQKAVEKKLRT